MKKYTHLFFDLDHTLWDYERNSEATLLQLYDEYNLLQVASFSASDFVKCFTKTNDQLWDRFHSGQIDQDYIREKRFPQIFKEFDQEFDFSKRMSDEYIGRCPSMGYIFPGALELLDHLNGRYELHIITNGFADIQDIKLSTTGLENYFGEIVISGNTGFRKPQKEIFQYALDKTGADHRSSIMIGDSIESDIQGAKNANMDQVLFNPKSTPHSEQVTYEIKELMQLKDLGF